MGKGKEVIVSWDDFDDDDLFDEDPIELNQGQSAPAKDDATPAAAEAAAATAAPARIFQKPKPAILTPMNEVHLATQDLRNEINQLSTSSNDINTLGQLQPTSRTSAGINHHADNDWKSESDWRNDRKGASKPTLSVKEDLRDAITTMTRQMRDLESPGTRATESVRTPLSRPLESGITLVAIRTSSDPKPASSSGRPSASDVIAVPPKRDSFRPKSRSRSRSRGREPSRRKNSRSRSRGRSWSRSRIRSWSRSRGRARSRSRDRSRERDTPWRYRSRSRGRSRSRDRRRSRERSRSRDGHKSREWSRAKDKDKDKDKDGDKDRDNNRDRDRNKDVNRWRTPSRSRSTDKYRPRGRSRTRSTLQTKAEEKPSSRTNSVSREAKSVITSASSSAHRTAQISTVATATTTSPSSPGLSTPLSTLRSPVDQPNTPSSSLPNTVRNNPVTLSQTTPLSNMETLIGSLDLTRPATLDTTTISSASSLVAEPTQTTNFNIASELEDSITTIKIKVEPEDPSTLAQAAEAPSPEVVVKQEPVSSDEATKILREASQRTTTSKPGLPDSMETEVGAQDVHYFVIRVSDEVDFNDARKSNVWNTNPMYDKALRELYSPTSKVFLIFTVFMSSEFCGIAKMASEMMWVGERTIFDKSNLRQKFKLQWVACSRVSYDSVKEVTHEPVYKIIRKNGHELTQDMGSAIHKLLVENQPEEEPQPTLALQQAESSALDITSTSFSQHMLMSESADAQEGSTLHLNSLFRDSFDMAVDLPGPATVDFQDKDKDEDEDDVDYDDDGTSMDLDSNSHTADDLIEFPSPKATLPRSPRALKRSISADENADLSVELALANEEREHSIRGHSMESASIERLEQKPEEREESKKEVGVKEEDKEMEMGETVFRRDASPIRARSPRKRDSPPPSLPLRRWSPSRRRSPPPPRRRSPPPSSSRNRSLPPPRRNRSPPPHRRRSPPPPRRKSPPPPSYYHQTPSYDRSRSATSTSNYYGFRSPPPFPQRSKDPRDRSASTHIFHSGTGPNYQRDRFSNAPMDPRLSGNRSASSNVVPQKRPYDETSGSMEDNKDGILANAVDLPASVFPLADDDEDGIGDHFAPPLQSVDPSAGASSSSSSYTALGGPSSSTSTVAPVDPPPQITSITLVPAGMSKSRRKKMRKEAYAKPLDF